MSRIKTNVRHKDDYYKTPPNMTRSLLHYETFEGMICEPACGDGAISDVLLQEDYRVASFDLVDRGYGVCGKSFLAETSRYGCTDLISNPPYKIDTAFVQHAFALGYRKMAFLLRLGWLEGEGRREKLFAKHPPVTVYVFSARQTMWNGSDPEPKDTGGMAAYAWFVFEQGFDGNPELRWIPKSVSGPHRKKRVRPAKKLKPTPISNPAEAFF